MKPAPFLSGHCNPANPAPIHRACHGGQDSNPKREWRPCVCTCHRPKETAVSTTEGLRFYPASHRYKLDGEWVSGVTTILGVLNKPGLPKWAATSVAEFVANNRGTVEGLYEMGPAAMVGALKETPWQRAKDAADRGTSIHDYAEAIIQGQEVDVPDILVPVVENLCRFMDEYQIQPVLVEAVVGSREHTYAGKLDLIADSNLGRAIFDYKSGKKVYPTTALQNAAYAFAEFHGENGDEKPLPEVERSFGVHIRADGYDLIPLEFGPRISDEFLTIRRAFEINKRMEGDWRTPGTGYAGIALPAPEFATIKETA